MNDETGLISQPNAAALPMVMREAQEVQAAVISARRFPRDQKLAFNRILDACKRPSLAEKGMYAYPRGGQTVTGPSIRLAEVCAQNWGNLQFGIKEIERESGVSIGEAFCWDLETNMRTSISFRVPHVREKKGGNVALVSDRDIYELFANMGARRLRKCILNCIPGDIIEAAEQECDKTLGTLGEKQGKVTELVGLFKKHAVSQENIERRVGKRIEAITGPEFVQLRKIYQSLEDGASTKADWFVDVLDPKKIMDMQTMDPAQKMQLLAENRDRAVKEFNALVHEVENAGGHALTILGVDEATVQGMRVDQFENCADVLRDWVKKNATPAKQSPTPESKGTSDRMEFRTDESAAKAPEPKAYAMIEKMLTDAELPDIVRSTLVNLREARKLGDTDHLELPQFVRLAKKGDIKGFHDFAMTRI